jgi:hypothetical protein
MGSGDVARGAWRYEFIVEVLDHLEETEDAEDIRLEADIYTSELMRWLGSRADRHGYVDEAIGEYGLDAKDGILALIQIGQIQEKQEVLASVQSFLENRLEELQAEAE